MKIVSILSSILAFGALSAYSQAAEAARSTAQVTIRAADKTIRPASAKKDDDDDEKKDKKPKPETVTKTIEINLSAAQTIKGPLKVVTLWYARDAATKKPLMKQKEETELALDAAKNAKLTVPNQTFTSTPAYTKKGKDSSEKIEAEGNTYYGWVIRAYEGSTLVGEASSSPPLLKLPTE